jgi:hypothetical protein
VSGNARQRVSRLPARPGRPSRGVRLWRTCLIDGDNPPLFSATEPCPCPSPTRRKTRVARTKRIPRLSRRAERRREMFHFLDRRHSTPESSTRFHAWPSACTPISVLLHFDRPPGPRTASLARRDGIYVVLLTLAYTVAGPTMLPRQVRTRIFLSLVDLPIRY